MVMPPIQSRRDFLVSATSATAASLIGARTALAGEPPPEVTTIRLRRDSPGPGFICCAPEYAAEELLRAEGFTDIQYIFVPPGLPTVEAFARGELDFALYITVSATIRLDAGVPITLLAGVHTGCFELFVHGAIQTVTDLNGKRVGILSPGAPDHLYLSIMAAYVGLDPEKDIHWVMEEDRTSTMELFVQGKIDAFLASVPEPQQLRARNVGRVILNTTTDKPWSEYFCCMLAGNSEFVRNNPIATKRVLRAILKANDLCAAEPERVTRYLIDRGFVEGYEYALETLREIPFAQWREFDPEDSLRFFALRQHEIGMITSTPGKIIAEGTDWRFLNELKRELKA
jgi:NitT/TauT family transport system substrate-binding protein